MFTTAVAAGSGLVGGTFAPSLFLGGMLGASFHNAVSGVLNSVNILGSTVFTIADVPAYGEEKSFLNKKWFLALSNKGIFISTAHIFFFFCKFIIISLCQLWLEVQVFLQHYSEHR
jgi:hypothetical protein